MYELFREEGFTGKLGLYDPQRPKKPFRPELTRLKDKLDRGEFQAVCVCGLDRLSRSPSLIPRLIEEVFSTGDVRFISVHESGLELDTPSGRAIAQLLNAINALYSEMTSQTVREAARRRLSLGYPIKPGFGWRWKAEKDPNGRRGIEPDPATAEGAKLIVRLFLDGMSTRKIAKELMARGVRTATGATRWDRKLVVDNLVQPLHYGLVRVREGEYVHGAHFDQRFFEPEDRERIAAMLEERTAEQRPVAMRPEYLLTGLAVCGHCGTPMRARQGRGRHRTYQCRRDSSTETPECGRNDCRAEWVERAALEQVRALVDHPETLARARQEAQALLAKQRGMLPEERRQLQGQIQRVGEQIARLVELLTQNLVEEREYREVMGNLRSRRHDLEQRLAQVQQRLDSGEQGFECWSRVEEALGNVGRLWEQMTAEERRDLLGEIVERVEVTRTPEGGHEQPVTLRTGQTTVTRIPPLRGQLLTPRQMAVLWLAGQGLSRQQIADRLGIDERAFDSLRRGARQRLGATDAKEAVKKAQDIIRPYVPWLDLEGRRNRHHRPEPSWPTATTEEHQVLELLAAGLNGTQIGERLNKSPNTVYVQLRNLRLKLGAANNDQLLRFAREAGMLPGAVGLGEGER